MFWKPGSSVASACVLLLVTVFMFSGCLLKTGPTASFHANPVSGTAPLTVQFTDTSLAGGSTITTWDWEFGDGQTSDDQSPSHEYAAAGAYSVTLTVTTAYGSDTSAPTTIIVTNEEGEAGFSVSPSLHHVLATASETVFEVTNTGADSVSWNAAVTTGNWLRITDGASGADNGTITVGYDANANGAPRTGVVTITPSGTTLSPVEVTVTQAKEGTPDDLDGDGLSNEDEDIAGSNPTDLDSDNDGLYDGDEVNTHDTSPILADTDGDGVSDGNEIGAGADPLVPETAPAAYKAMAASINDMTAQLQDDLKTMSLDDALQNAATYLSGQSNVSSVQFDASKSGSPPTLWADFADYATYVVLVAPKTSSGAAKFLTPDELASASVGKARGAKQTAAEKSFDFQGFPKRSCVFANLFDAGTNTANTSTLYQMMKNKKYDVDLVTGNGGGVDFFKTLANYGLVYLDTHGGFIQDKKAAAQPYYGLLRTSDGQNVVQDQTYLANGDFSSRRVMISTRVITNASDLAKVPAGKHYCISNKFIEQYVGEFENHSLVFLNCCQTAKLPSGAIPDYSDAPLFSAFLGKNAGDILGWTESVTDQKAMNAGSYFFSRMLGDNDAFAAQTPPIAPYDFGDTYAALLNKGYGHDATYNADFVGYIRGYSEDVILAPRINFLVTDLEDEQMEIHGTFGSNGTPTVKAGDQQLTVVERDTDTILVDLPDDAKGPVTVEILNHKSNAVPLTEWNGTFNLQSDAGVMVPGVNATIQCRWRGDIHSQRSQYPEDEAELPQLEMSTCELDSVYTYDFTSSYSNESTRYDYSGSGSVNQTLDGEGDTWLGGNVMMYMSAGSIQFIVYAVASLTMNVTDLKTGSTQSYTLPYSVGLVFTWPIGEYGDIAAGSTTANGTIQVTWDAFEVNGAPDASTPAP